MARKMHRDGALILIQIVIIVKVDKSRSTTNISHFGPTLKQFEFRMHAADLQLDIGNKPYLVLYWSTTVQSFSL